MSSEPSDAGKLSLPAGTRLSDTYEIEREIGLGGMAEVYRAHNVHTGDLVAIKLVLPEFARDETILALFKKEGTVLSRLRHDAIVHYHVFTVEREMGRPYLVMDFVDGMSLSDKMAEGPIEPQAVRQMLLRVAAGLELAHSFGVIHRDLSPDNIILPHGDVRLAKIIDFGIAKAATIGEGTVLGGGFAGKYNYVSPEQLGLHAGEVTQQSDIYSLGLVGAAALRGRPLDMGGSHVQVLEKRRILPVLGDIDEGLRPVLEAMLQPGPGDRPAGMSAVIGLLQRPPAAEGKTMVRHKDDTHVWAGPAIERDAPTPLMAHTSIAPQAAAEPVVPLFDPIKPTAGSGESPFGSFVPPPGGAFPSGVAPTTPPRAAVLPGPRRSIRLSALLVILAAAGSAGWGYTQGWFGQGADVPASLETAASGPEVAQRPSSGVTTPQTEQPDGDVAPAQPIATETPAVVNAPPVDGPIATATPEASTPVLTQPLATRPSPADPITVAALELTSQRVAWVRSYPMQACQHMSMVSAAGDTVSVEGFATNPGVFEALDAEFRAINGKEPDIVLQPITEAQCPVADFLRAIESITTRGPALELSSRVVSDGVPLPINLVDNGGWQTSLFLVDDEGAIYDISAMLPTGDGAFSLELNLSGPQQAVPGILLAIAFPPNTAITPLEGSDAVSYLPQLALDIAKIPERVSVNAQYFQLRP